ncbi:MAG: hypothetical protein JSR48_11105 [Verrucomicrobia bacterium]|nr:hypothetical protein [Verrucomicrobiota bacterium]
MRCRHCGARFNRAETIPPFRASCPRCARIAPPVLVERQGDGRSGFREIMIRQNPGEFGRKQLESPSFSFVVFLAKDGGVLGFDLEDRDLAHLYQWRRGEPPRFFGVRNVGKGYHNRDEVYINGRFDPTAVLTELRQCGANIRAEIREALVEGIRAYR